MGPLGGPDETSRGPKEGPNRSSIRPLKGPKKKDRIECGVLQGSGKRPYLNLRGTWKEPHRGSVRNPGGFGKNPAPGGQRKVQF
jgi:hypothetical protein